MSTLTQNSGQVLKCTACGADLPVDARFCEQCGHAVLPESPLSQAAPNQSEYLLGHIPVYLVAGKGFFGRTKRTDYELLVTNHQLIFLYSSSWAGTRWLQEQYELDFDKYLANEEFSQWRSMMEQYDFAKPLWSDYYSTSFEELLSADKHNFALKVNDLVSAGIELDNELESLELLCTDGTQYHCGIYLLLDDIAGRLLAQVLDSSQLKMARNQP